MPLANFINDKNQNSVMNKDPYFLSLQGSYNHIEYALFKGEKCVRSLYKPNAKASRELIPLLDELFVQTSTHLPDLDFIALDQGPGAFTSLRVIITTANGLSFASKVPLIGIDGIDALAEQTAAEHKSGPYKTLLVLLNAFNHDVYYGLYGRVQEKISLQLPKWYNNIDALLAHIRTLNVATPLLCVGNAVELYEEKIREALGSNVVISSPATAHASAQQIGIMALEKWRTSQEHPHYLLPLYLKTQTFKPKYSYPANK